MREFINCSQIQNYNNLNYLHQKIKSQMDQVLRDLGLENLIPAFGQHKITVSNFDYLLKNNCPGGPLHMIMEQTGLVIGDFLTIMERIEKTSHNPLNQKQMI